MATDKQCIFVFALFSLFNKQNCINFGCKFYKLDLFYLKRRRVKEEGLKANTVSVCTTQNSLTEMLLFLSWFCLGKCLPQKRSVILKTKDCFLQYKGTVQPKPYLCHLEHKLGYHVLLVPYLALVCLLSCIYIYFFFSTGNCRMSGVIKCESKKKLMCSFQEQGVR